MTDQELNTLNTAFFSNNTKNEWCTMTELNLSYSDLETLPLELANLTNLEYLYLDGNPLL
jgi:Leucine-rich repeat (LRR) protein